jgi:hypothetical protein
MVEVAMQQSAVEFNQSKIQSPAQSLIAAEK